MSAAEIHVKEKRSSDDTLHVLANSENAEQNRLVKMDQPTNTPEKIRGASVAGIPPPKNLPLNSPKNHYKPTWESLESRPIPQWYENAKVRVHITRTFSEVQLISFHLISIHIALLLKFRS